jgi:uncharacterized protein
MMPPLLTRQQLELLNRRTLRYPLAIAEKDYFLALALTIIAQSPLNDILVFKGGTALHHCYLSQHRFSEDLDFTALRHDLTLDDVVAVLEADGLFTAKKVYTSPATIKIERMLYAGVLGHASSIKIEIDQVQNVILPAQPVVYHNVWNIPLTLPVMDIREVCAEKLRAACQRARYRDFYDLYLILETFALDFEEVIALLRQKEIRKPIRRQAMLANWQVASEQQMGDLKSIYCTRTIANEQITALLTSLQFADIEA